MGKCDLNLYCEGLYSLELIYDNKLLEEIITKSNELSLKFLT